jgi:IS30 family transposase
MMATERLWGMTKAWARTRRPKRCKLATNPWLRQAVASKLRLNWAPEQIAGWLKRAHPEGERYQVSHETIYRSLFVLADHRRFTFGDQHRRIFLRSAKSLAARLE